MMRILVLEPAYTPYEATFRDAEQAAAKILKTEGEMFLPFDNDVIALVCSARPDGQRPNRIMPDGSIVYGRCFLCGFDGETLCSLTRKQAERYYRRYIYPEKFSISADGAVFSVSQYPRVKPKDERFGERGRGAERQ